MFESNKDRTEILSADADGIKKASALLTEGSLVVFPTETVYGLGADATSYLAISELFAVKKRPQINPLIVHIKDIDTACNLAEIPEAAWPLIEKFWPGPLTLVVQRKKICNSISNLVTSNLETIALRVPDHPIALRLLTEFAKPIAAPSANLSGKLSTTRTKDVFSNFRGKISAILDGGSCSIGLESTIICFESNKPIILRLGGIPLEAIENQLNQKVIIANEVRKSVEKISSPGQMLSHYAPKARLKLNVVQPKENELYMGFGFMPTESIGLNLSETSNLIEASTKFFATLHDLDKMAEQMKIDIIAVAPIPKLGLGLSLNDRLKRAATENS